jgi:hypothetical protein
LAGRGARSQQQNLSPCDDFAKRKSDPLARRALTASDFSAHDYDTRVPDHRKLNRYATETDATIPLLQSVLTIVHTQNLSYQQYANGWLSPQTLHGS